MRKKIAVIVAGIDETYQSSILNGIRSCDEPGFDFYAFVSFTGMMDNRRHDTGELNIFSLPDFSAFDGAILLTNTIDYTPVVNNILERIKSAGIPAVSIDNQVDGFLHIGIDNKSAMREITEHFINVHGFTDFSYISGPADNSESSARLEAFREVLAEHGLTIDEEHVFYGDFRAASGRNAVNYFISNFKSMPQAIVCANDVMAAAAVNRLFEAGYSVPDDVAISGFDNTFTSHNLRVDLTSVKRPLVESGQLACRMLINYFNNVKQNDSEILNMSTNFTESCGCGKNIVRDISEYKELNIRMSDQIETTMSYMSMFNKFSCKLHGCSNFDSYIDALKRFVDAMHPNEFYFCLCCNWWREFVEDNGNIRKSDDIPTAYTREMNVAIAYANGKFYDDMPVIDRREIFPKIETSADHNFYYILPLHFGERCLGYMVINICSISLHNALFHSWCITMNNALENVRKLRSLDYAVMKLSKLYAQDTFSGIYNRNGFVLATTDIFKACVKESRHVMLMFIDLDGLKTINDSLGHDVGDIAIRSVAEVLNRSCTNKEIFCRFGGDEFIVFAADYTEQDADNLTAKIQENIDWVNRAMDNAFKLSASTGYVIATPQMGDDLFKFVTQADKVMYETKRKKKLSKNLRQ